MNSFYREQKIKSPRKTYTCHWCGEAITGEHLYIAGKTTSSDFTAVRAHEECQTIMSNYCAGCPDGDPCLDQAECYKNAVDLRENGGWDE